MTRRMLRCSIVFLILYASAEATTPTLLERAQKGDAIAQCELGQAYYLTNNLEAAKWFRKSAEQGNASAQFLLGKMYERGEGVPKDGEEAVKWIVLAAEQGRRLDQCALGIIYAEGKIVPKDSAKAEKWFRKAAELGEPSAQSKLGEIYARGDGVIKDLVEAHSWLNVASAFGDIDARSQRDNLEREMTREQIAAATKLARERFDKIQKNQREQPASHAEAKERSRQASTSLNRASSLTNRIARVTNIGVVGIDARWSEYGEYLNTLIEIVQVQWYKILAESRVSPPRGSHVVVTFKINSKGETEIVKVEDADAGRQGVFSCQNAITYPQPYGKWTDTMITALGDSQELTFSFYFQ